jgi:hydroxyacylglutathione hydrolase
MPEAAFRVVTVPCLKDNYAYLVVCRETGEAAVVDPSEGAPVLEAVRREGVTVRAVWNTHHHHDHVGGNAEVVAAFPGVKIEVVAHVSDRAEQRVPGQTRGVEEGDEVVVGKLRAAIVFNPGHTRGAVSYFIADGGAVFTGDTMFAAGCGRLFEGTAAQMYDSLTRLAALPEDTRVYCGHEYTASNLKFAAAAEPGNEAVAERAARVAMLRERGDHTMGFTLAEERATNPFVRAGTAERFAELRAWKDRF